ncbi:hypothetical protein D3C79_969930 [compost metagenome]
MADTSPIKLSICNSVATGAGNDFRFSALSVSSVDAVGGNVIDGECPGDHLGQRVGFARRVLGWLSRGLSKLFG